MLNLVTVVGENTHILPHMLKHYEGVVDKFHVAVYRQSEDDGILEEVEKLGIEPYHIKLAREEAEEKAKKKQGIKDDKKDIVIESIDTIN